MNIKEFVNKYKITVDCELVDSNPFVRNVTSQEREWNRKAMHWKCVLKMKKKVLTVPFSQGCAICREPTVIDLVDSMRSDCSCVEYASSFEDYCAEYGLNSDSREDFFRWGMSVKHCRKVRKFFGVEAMKELMECEGE